MKRNKTAALLLAVFLLAGCGKGSASASTAKATETLVNEETVVLTVSDGASAPKTESLLSFWEDEGPEEGIRMTGWSYNGAEAAEFCSILLPVPEGFPIDIGTMYEGPEAALLCGAVRGDAESGTAEMILAEKSGETQTLLTLMYSRDRVALLELNADMLSFCAHDEASGLWSVVFTDESELSFEDAAQMLEGVLESYSLSPAFSCYGLAPAGNMDLRLPQAD